MNAPEPIVIRTPPLATLTESLVENLEREIRERSSSAAAPIHLHLRLRGMIPMNALHALARLLSNNPSRIEGLFTLESHPHTYCHDGNWLAKLFGCTANLRQASFLLPAKPVDVDSVMESIQSSVNSMEYLHLVKGSYNSQESPVPAIAQYVSHCERLQHLDLNFISLAASDAEILIPAILELLDRQKKVDAEGQQQQASWPELNFLAITSGHIQEHSISFESLPLLTQLVRALPPTVSWKVTKTGGSLFPSLEDFEMERDATTQSYLAAMRDHPPCEIVERQATPYLATQMLQIAEHMKPGGPDDICALALHGAYILNPPAIVAPQSTNSWAQLLNSLPRMRHLTSLVVLSFGSAMQMKIESDEYRRQCLREALHRNTSLLLANFGVLLKPPRVIFERNAILVKIQPFLHQSTDSSALLPHVIAATGTKNPTPDAVFAILRAQCDVIPTITVAKVEQSTNDTIGIGTEVK